MSNFPQSSWRWSSGTFILWQVYTTRQLSSIFKQVKSLLSKSRWQNFLVSESCRKSDAEELNHLRELGFHLIQKNFSLFFKLTWNWSSLKDILYPGIQFNNLILTSQFQEKITNQVSCSHINNLNFLHSIDCHLQFLPFQLQLIRPMIHVTKNSKICQDVKLGMGQKITRRMCIWHIYFFL